MKKISNSEKQARYRRKELLKRRADEIFNSWQISFIRNESMNPLTIKSSLDRISDLPSGWTDQDYTCAENSLESLRVELLRDVERQLELDVDVAHEVEVGNQINRENFLKSNLAIENTRALSNHLISAMELSRCSNAEKAAALMEAVRFIGRSLVNDPKVSPSQANVFCMASIRSWYRRPDWFIEEFNKMIRDRIGGRFLEELATLLKRSKKSEKEY